MKVKKVKRLITLSVLFTVLLGSMYMVHPTGFTIDGGVTMTLAMPSTAYTGHTFYVDITVSGTFLSSPAYLERYSNGAWSTVKTFDLESSNIRITYSQSQTGTYNFRVRSSPLGSVIYSNTETVTFYSPPVVTVSVSHSSIMLSEQYYVTTSISQGESSPYTVSLIETSPSGNIKTVDSFSLTSGSSYRTFIRKSLSDEPGVYKYQALINPSSTLSNIASLTIQDTSLAGFTFELEETRTNYIRKTYDDYLEGFYFYKPANYKAQVHTTIPADSDSGIEFTVKYKRVYVYSYSWAPMAQIVFENSDGSIHRRFYMSNRASQFLWGYSGEGIASLTMRDYSNPFTQNTWYEWRIRLYHASAGSTSWVVEFSYKQASSSTWTIKGSYGIIGALSDTITIKLGSYYLYDYSYPGSTDRYYFASPSLLTLQDRDGDGLTDQEEYAFRSQGIMVDPNNPDTDGDGLLDGQELSTDPEQLKYTAVTIGKQTSSGLVSHSIVYSNSWNDYYYSNPTDPDTDDDGILDGEEMQLGSSPCNTDSDRDGIPDGSDSSPTVYDTESPAFIDVSGVSFDFEDATITVPTDNGEVYLYIERVNVGVFETHDYLIVGFQDNRGIDKIEIWTTGRDFSDEYSKTFTLNNFKGTYVIGLDIPVGVLDSYSIHIKATDTVNSIEYYETEFSYDISSSFETLLKKAGELMQQGLNWVVNQIKSLGAWIQSLGSAAIDAANAWIQAQYDQAKQFIIKMFTNYINPILNKLQKSIWDVFNGMAHYQAGTLSAFRDNLLGPLTDVFDKIIDFTEEYDTEITMAIESIKLLASILNPADLALQAVSFLGTAVMDGGILEGLVGDMAQLTSTVAQTVADTINQGLVSALELFLPPTFTLETSNLPHMSETTYNTLFNDMLAFGLPPFIETFVQSFIDKVSDFLDEHAPNSASDWLYYISADMFIVDLILAEGESLKEKLSDFSIILGSISMVIDTYGMFASDVAPIAVSSIFNLIGMMITPISFILSVDGLIGDIIEGSAQEVCYDVFGITVTIVGLFISLFDSVQEQ